MIYVFPLITNKKTPLRINAGAFKNKEKVYSQNPAIKPNILKMMIDEEKNIIMIEEFKKQEPFKQWAIDYCLSYNVVIPYQLTDSLKDAREEQEKRNKIKESKK